MLKKLKAVFATLSRGAGNLQGAAATTPEPQHSPVSARPETLVRFRCPNCGKRLRTHARNAGRQGRCHRCGMDQAVPAGYPALCAAKAG
jgi:hypothetical protein